MEIYYDFIHGDPWNAWDGLMKLTESFNSTSNSKLKDLDFSLEFEVELRIWI